jgi:signal transduction histidine kinase
MFDYVQLQRYGIKISDLPKDSIVINRPDSFWYKYKHLIIAVLVFVILQTLIIVWLLINISMRRRAESELRYMKDNLEVQVAKKTEELVKAQERLVEAERLAAIGQIGGTVSHEFRNQLGVMRNAVFYLRTKLKGSDPKIKKHLNILDTEIIQTDKIIEDILSFARTKSTECSHINIHDLFEKIEQIVGFNDYPAIQFTLNVDEGIQEIYCDASQFVQIMVNIIKNAIDSIVAHGAINIEVSRDVDCLLICVTDSGTGIPDDVLEHVFEPLYTTKARGTGLGLPTVKILVERLDGDIDISSIVGEGTQVMIKIPDV